MGFSKLQNLKLKPYIILWAVRKGHRRQNILNVGEKSEEERHCDTWYKVATEVVKLMVSETCQPPARSLQVM